VLNAGVLPSNREAELTHHAGNQLYQARPKVVYRLPAVTDTIFFERLELCH